jgi:MFS family permease
VGWKARLGALRIPGFRWYWSSQLISGLGTWSQSVAQAWLVITLTHSESQAAVWLGTITMLQFLPFLLFAMIGGVVADRRSRRELLVLTQSLAAIQAIVLGALVATGSIRLWELGALAFALGTTNAFNNPAQQSFIPELVGREHVADAVALNSVQFNSARMLGAAIGGVTVALWGVAGTLFLNALSYLPAIAVLLWIRPAYASRRPAARQHSVVGELALGFRYVRQTPKVLRVVLIFGGASLIGLNWQVVLPLVSRFVVHQQATGLGALMAAFGVGSLTAAILLTQARQLTMRRLISGGVILGISLALLGWSHTYLLSLIVVAAGGAASIVLAVTTNTALQLFVPDQLRGRVMGIYVLLMGGTTPIGAYVFGAVSSRFGPEPTLIAFGLATSLIVVLSSLHGATHRRSMEA